MADRSSLEDSITRWAAQRVRQARLEKNMTLEEMATAIHAANGSVISRYENGTRELSIEVLEQIAKVTDRDIAWFLSDPNEETKFDTENAELDEKYWKRMRRLLSELTQQELDDASNFYDFLIFQRSKTDPANLSLDTNGFPRQLSPMVAQNETEYSEEKDEAETSDSSDDDEV